MIDYWDVNSSFNLIDNSFDKISEQSYFSRNLYETVAGIAPTVFTSTGIPISGSLWRDADKPLTIGYR